MKERELKVVEKFKQLVSQRVKVYEVKVFGSRARGDSYLESDYDLIVLVDQESKVLNDKIFNVSCKIGWEHNVVITVFVHEQSYYESKKYEPLFMNIRKEGVHI